MTDGHTEESLFALLHRQYQARVMSTAVVRHASAGHPHHYFSSQSGIPGKNHSVRRIDALVLFRDKRWAVEIKVTASDLMRELREPDKTEAWEQYVHGFYFLVPDSLSQTALAAVPRRYGVMVPQGRYGVSIVRRAPRRPDPLDIPVDTWRRMAERLGARQYEDLGGHHR